MRHGPLLSMAIGDAFGAAFEFVDSKPKDLGGYRQHPRHNIEPGQYTDDTQMALALAELMLGQDPQAWTPYHVAWSFLSTFRRDPRAGYAKGFKKKLDEWSLIGDVRLGAISFLLQIRPHSLKSGGAMRAGPLGLLPSQEDVVDRAMFQASLTHATREGMEAAAISALMVHYFHYGLGRRENLPVFLHEVIPGPWAQPWQGKVGSRGIAAVHAAVSALCRHKSMSVILKTIVNYSGDVDTVAAIALCAASRAQDIAQDLPDVLYEGLENGPYGRQHLEEVDAKLLERWPGKQAL